MKKRNEIDFFSEEYWTENEQNSSLAGIIDQTPAKTITDKPEIWNATIVNKEQRIFRFVPIDYNIEIDRGDGNKESTCDGMVLCKENKFIAFVELKADSHNNTAKDQLYNTISIFSERHDITKFSARNRRAYISNRKQRESSTRFHSSHKELIEKFRDKLGFKIFQQTEIEIP